MNEDVAPAESHLDSQKWSTITTRWTRRMAVVHALMTGLAMAYLSGLLVRLPHPKPFTAQSDLAAVINDGRAMLRDLKSQTTLRTFRLDSSEYLAFLVASAPDEIGDSESIVAHSDHMVSIYREDFEVHAISVKYLFASAMSALLVGILVACVPRIWNAVLLVMISMAGTSFGSELLAGRDLSDLFVYTAPYLVIAVLIWSMAAVTWFSRKTEADRSTGQAWLMIAFGILALVLGGAWASVEILDGARLSYRQSQGVAAPIASGLLCVFYGIKDLRATRPGRRQKTNGKSLRG